MKSQDGGGGSGAGSGAGGGAGGGGGGGGLGFIKGQMHLCQSTFPMLRMPTGATGAAGVNPFKKRALDFIIM